MITDEVIVIPTSGYRGATIESVLCAIAERMSDRNCKVLKVRVGYDILMTCIIERGSMTELSEVED